MKAEYDIPELCLDWVIPERLAALAAPDEAQLARLARLGFGVLISLNESPPPSAAVIRHGMDHVAISFADHTAPAPEQIERFVSVVADRLATGQTVGVHCAAGVGRTGTMIACYLVSTGMTPEQAIATVRRRRPGAVETTEQERAVWDYWRRLRGKHRSRSDLA
jgi:atypical dual specificity phosphatase